MAEGCVTSRGQCVDDQGGCGCIWREFCLKLMGEVSAGGIPICNLFGGKSITVFHDSDFRGSKLTSAWLSAQVLVDGELRRAALSNLGPLQGPAHWRHQCAGTRLFSGKQFHYLNLSLTAERMHHAE